MKKVVKNIKDFEKSAKKSQNLAKKYEKLLKNDFIEFVEGVQEDEPLKDEAVNIYFVLEFSQNDIVLSYSADEKLFSIFDYGAYFPHDAEYFYSNALKQLARQLFDKKSISKQAVFDMLKKVVFEASNKISFFKNHRIYFGERFSEVYA